MILAAFFVGAAGLHQGAKLPIILAGIQAGGTTVADRPKIARNKWPENPGYELTVTPFEGRVRVRFAGATVADSRSALLLLEQGHSPVYYLPQRDLHMELVRPSEHRSHCPYKGHCSYYSIVVGDKVSENAIWSYEDPYPEIREITGLVAFYPNRVDAIDVE